MIKIDEDIRRPELGAQFLSCNQFSRSFKQRGQHLQRLFLKLYPLSPLAQFPGVEIDSNVLKRIIRDEELADTGTSTGRSLTPFEHSSDLLSSGTRF